MKITSSIKKNAMYLFAGLAVGALASWQLTNCYKESQAEMFNVGFEMAKNEAVFTLYEHYQNTGNTNVADILKENINRHASRSLNLLKI